jgi:hypothetical protein
MEQFLSRKWLIVSEEVRYKGLVNCNTIEEYRRILV